jgi:hypothetical protein
MSATIGGLTRTERLQPLPPVRRRGRRLCSRNGGGGSGALLSCLLNRDGRWCIVDLVGKHGRVRTVPMPNWVKVAIDTWTGPARVSDGCVFRSVNRGDKVQGTALSEKAVRQMLPPPRQPPECPGSRRTIVGARQRNYAAQPAGNWSRFRCCSVTRRFRPPSAILAPSKTWLTRRTMPLRCG